MTIRLPRALVSTIIGASVGVITFLPVCVYLMSMPRGHIFNETFVPFLLSCMASTALGGLVTGLLRRLPELICPLVTALAQVAGAFIVSLVHRGSGDLFSQFIRTYALVGAASGLATGLVLRFTGVLVDRSAPRRPMSPRVAGLVQMLYGGVACVASIVIVVILFRLAGEGQQTFKGGGFVLVVGIVWGALQFFRGLGKVMTPDIQPHPQQIPMSNEEKHRDV